MGGTFRPKEITIFNIKKLTAIQALVKKEATVQITPSPDRSITLLVDGVKFTENTIYSEACDVLTGVANDGLSDNEVLAIEASEKYTNSEFGECHECGGLFMRDNASQVTNHLEENLTIDHYVDGLCSAY